MEENQKFFDKIIESTNLQTVNEAQVAAKVVYRLLRDMIPQDKVDQVASELETGTEASEADMEIKDLWKDTNPMVSFFSQFSPVRQFNISPDVFKLRLQQEGALPTDCDPESVTKAIFRATKDELPQEQVQNISQSLSGDIRQWWEQA